MKFLSANERSSLGCYPTSTTSYTSDLGEKFTGQHRDETRLDYFIARNYADGQGRFASADPLSGWPGDPQSWNMYGYARNNPLLYVDPTGLTHTVCMNYFGESGEYCEDDVSDRDFAEWYNTVGLGAYVFSGAPNPLADIAFGSFQPRFEGLSPGRYRHTSVDDPEFYDPAPTEDEHIGVGVGGGAGTGRIASRAIRMLGKQSCRNIFNRDGTGPDPRTVLQSAFNPFDSRYGQLLVGPVPSGVLGTPNATYNPYGRTFRYLPSGRRQVNTSSVITFNEGRMRTRSDEELAATLLHEEGHIYESGNAPGGTKIEPDNLTTIAGAAASKRNADLINHNCR